MSKQSIQLPTLEDLVLWATKKPHFAPIGKVRSEDACPLSNYMDEQYPERKWYAGMHRIIGVQEGQSIEADMRFDTPDPLHDVIKLVDTYPYAGRERDIPCSAFLHILQEVRRAYEEKEGTS